MGYYIRHIHQDADIPANGTGHFIIALSKLLHKLRIARSSYNYFNVLFIKNLNCTSAHTTTDDDIYTTIGKKIRQESGALSGEKRFKGVVKVK